MASLCLNVVCAILPARLRRFLVEQVDKPADNQNLRCFATATDAQLLRRAKGFSRNWLRCVISAGAGASDYFDMDALLET
jgi:hypothetical protein